MVGDIAAAGGREIAASRAAIRAKLGVVLVNYNNSELTRQALESLFRGDESDHVVGVIVDNASRQSEVDKLASIELNFPSVVVLRSSRNLGYFSGLNLGIAHLRSQYSGIDTILIGNNDLVFPPDFVGRVLAHQGLRAEHAVLSPDIVTLDGIHQNPHSVNGISRGREIVYDLYYRYYAFALAIAAIARISRTLTRRRDTDSHRLAGKVCLGYGACYVLGPKFFSNYDRLWAPTFLMGEELFLSRQLECRDLHIFYDPSLRLDHHDHATMHQVPSRRIWEFARASHAVYRTFVNPYRHRMRRATSRMGTPDFNEVVPLSPLATAEAEPRNG